MYIDTETGLTSDSDSEMRERLVRLMIKLIQKKNKGSQKAHGTLQRAGDWVVSLGVPLKSDEASTDWSFLFRACTGFRFAHAKLLVQFLNEDGESLLPLGDQL